MKIRPLADLVEQFAWGLNRDNIEFDAGNANFASPQGVHAIIGTASECQLQDQGDLLLYRDDRSAAG